MMIPVYEPWVGEEEAAAVADAVRRGELSGLSGKSLEAFEHEFAEYVGSEYGVATNSGTTALQLAVRACGFGKGSEALVSATTNIATALAVHYQGGVTVPVDAEPRIWNMNLNLLEELISEKTRLILPVHHFGHPVEMDRLIEMADRRGLVVIEDCAEAHGAECHGRRVGSFGTMSCFSFLANKIITTGEGGMVVTRDKALAERLRNLRNLGFGQPRFFHPEAAYNFRMTGFQAAMGRVQLGKIGEVLTKKRRVAMLYSEGLKGVEMLQLPGVEPWARHVYWVYGVVLLPEWSRWRDPLREFLLARGVDTRTFFCPMNQQPFLRHQPGYRDVPCPVSDRLWQSGLYLPSSPGLSDEVVANICRLIQEFWSEVSTKV